MAKAKGTWDALIGQDAPVRFLRAALRSGRDAHGYLFEGPAGVGKRTAALLLAKVWLCHEPPEPDEACGECKSCRWIDAAKGGISDHPDLLPVVKYDLQGHPTDKVVGDHEVSIPLATVQYLTQQLHRAPMNGPRRVAIVPEAQRLCRGQAESGNAFLKTLEEPPAGARLIFTSSRPEGLLDTIVSRLQPVRFRRLGAKEIARGLAAGNREAEEIELAVALADGSLGRAKELLDGDLGRWRRQVLQGLDRFTPKDCPAFGLALWALAEQEGKRLFEADELEPDEATAEADEDGEEDEAVVKTEAGWKRFAFTRLLELCEVAFRDAMCAAAAGPDVPLLQADAAKLSGKLAERFGALGCERVLEALREALFATRMYVRGDLVGRVLAGRMVDAMVP